MMARRYVESELRLLGRENNWSGKEVDGRLTGTQDGRVIQHVGLVGKEIFICYYVHSSRRQRDPHVAGGAR